MLIEPNDEDVMYAIACISEICTGESSRISIERALANARHRERKRCKAVAIEAPCGSPMRSSVWALLGGR